MKRGRLRTDMSRLLFICPSMETHECNGELTRRVITKLLYEKDMITERDYYNTINTARKTGMSEGMSAGMEQGLQRGLQQGLQKGLESGLKKGREEGLRKGREEGLLEGQHRIAKAMKAKGMSSQMITELTGISEDEIAEL